MNGTEEKPREAGWSFQHVAMILLLGSGIGGVGNWAIPNRGTAELTGEVRELKREIEKMRDDVSSVTTSYHGHLAVSDYWVDRIRSLEGMHTRAGRDMHPQMTLSPIPRFPEKQQ